MTSIGERLRRQRLQNRTTLEKVSLETKIGVRMLEAIEAGEFDKLPGGVFRRSFVLQYARALELDPEDIAAELDQLHPFDEIPALPIVDPAADGDARTKAGISFRQNVSAFRGSTLGSLIAAVGVMMACALVYSWWQTTSSPKPEASPIPHAAPTQVAHTDAAPLEPAHNPVASTSPEAGRVEAPAKQPGTLADAVAKPADTSRLRVGLIVDERTWVSISSDGKNVFSMSLEPHETRVVEASQKVRLLVGNAGGVEISLNGKPIGPIGPKGQVRVVELTPAGFQIVSRKPPTLEPL